MMKLILPFRELPEECLSIGPSQGLAYGLDRDIILKVPFQYEVTAEVDMAHCWDLSLGSLVAMEKELAVYEALRDRPHDNFTRRLASEDNLTRKLAPDQSEFLLLERLQPLQEAWPDSSLEDRLRWVSELVAAVGWLEKLGFVHGDLAVRNLGIDTTQRLKLFDFGSATPCSHPDYSNDVGRDHFHLATCLHFILSGVDPFDHVSSHAEAVETRSLLESGQWKIAKGAEILADVIQDGWTGRTGSSTFGQLSSLVAEVVGTRDQGSIPALSESHYQHLECRCRDWLRRAERDPLWKAPDEYVLACRGVGHEADLDLWR
ncbi:kinase domain containing protein [Ophiocordyceps sinensis CO18]|uniref:Kinase domain containing protein n=1 Tax=Ophiocordyceps sinensis (strain Co18 / CGMCC 3.14243) TaxID=911162 RepID=T5A8S0_OPHSC|nr:kinase domain containing protein [Ophiocordyceps sinensis CO18]